MAKPNYEFEKRRRELEKKKKMEEKRLRKLEKAHAGDAPAVASVENKMLFVLNLDSARPGRPVTINGNGSAHDGGGAARARPRGFSAAGPPRTQELRALRLAHAKELADVRLECAARLAAQAAAVGMTPEQVEEKRLEADRQLRAIEALRSENEGLALQLERVRGQRDR